MLPVQTGQQAKAEGVLVVLPSAEPPAAEAKPASFPLLLCCLAETCSHSPTAPRELPLERGGRRRRGLSEGAGRTGAFLGPASETSFSVFSQDFITRAGTDSRDNAQPSQHKCFMSTLQDKY